jgi:hypothetical protein
VRRPIAPCRQQLLAHGAESRAELPQLNAPAGEKRQLEIPIVLDGAIHIAQIEGDRRARSRGQNSRLFIEAELARALA